MRLSTRSLRMVAILTIAMLGLSGCFQNASEGGLEPTNPANAAPTAFVFPTNTPELVQPTDEGEAQPPIEQQPGLPTQPGVILPSPTPDSGLVDGQGGTDLLPSPTPAAIAIQPTANIGMLELTATAIMAGVQGQAFATPTATNVVPQLAATLPQVVQITPLAGELTATAIIAQATARVGATQTAVATTLGTYVPTLLPTFGPTLEPVFLTATALAAPVSEDCVHSVSRGENAYRIARRYGVTLDQIARANGLTNLSILSIGQQLIIPGCGNLVPTPGPGLDDGQGGVSTTTGGACGSHYIQPGENLYRIALRYAVSLRELANVNGIANINIIKAGDTLTIPCQ